MKFENANPAMLGVDEDHYASNDDADDDKACIPGRAEGGNLEIDDFDGTTVEVIEGVEPEADQPRVEHVEHVEHVERTGRMEIPRPESSSDVGSSRQAAIAAREAHRRRLCKKGQMMRREMELRHDNAPSFNIQAAFDEVRECDDQSRSTAADDIQVPLPHKPEDAQSQWPFSGQEQTQMLGQSLIPRLRMLENDATPGESNQPDAEDLEKGKGKGKGKQVQGQKFQQEMSNLIEQQTRGRPRHRNVKWDRLHTKRLGHGRWAARSQSCRRGRSRERSLW